MSAPENTPAFPGAYFDHLEGVGEVRREQYHGMTLRDWFAGQALQRIMDREIPNPFMKYDAISADYAAQAYMVADAMLAARTPKEPQP